jgi:hypothetical protein
MTAIYYITHSLNLPNILMDGGLWCDAESVKRNIQPVEIAYTEIKERRIRRKISIPPDGVLAEYVPFYFCNRSPMLYTIYKGNVPAYRDGQANILHLVGSAESVSQASLPFVFSDGHAVVQLSLFYNDLQRLNEVDWKVVNSWSWHDTAEDNDRLRRKQAEFLVKGHFPFSFVQEIGTYSAAIREQVLPLLENLERKPIVNIQRKWYYD